MSNTEEKTNEMDETLEKVIVEEEVDQLLKNESGQETDTNLQNDNKVDELITKSDKQLQHKYMALMYDLEKNNPSWMDSEQGMEEYMELQNKIYEKIDNDKFKSLLVKGSVIPKELREE